MVFRALLLVLLQIFSSQTPSSAGPIYAFPVVGCKTTYAHVHHDYPATDVLTKAGCKFVAVTSGVVDEVRRVDQWSGKTNLPQDRGGLWVSIIGDDGVRYYGSHLKKVQTGIEPGVRVNAGDLLGLVGATGDARGTAPHVHFGISWPTAPDIWWVRRGMLYPWKYLDAWQAGKDLSPAKSVAALHAKVGDIPPLPKK